MGCAKIWESFDMIGLNGSAVAVALRATGRVVGLNGSAVAVV